MLGAQLVTVGLGKNAADLRMQGETCGPGGWAGRAWLATEARACGSYALAAGWAALADSPPASPPAAQRTCCSSLRSTATAPPSRLPPTTRALPRPWAAAASWARTRWQVRAQGGWGAGWDGCGSAQGGACRIPTCMLSQARTSCRPSRPDLSAVGAYLLDAGCTWNVPPLELPVPRAANAIVAFHPGRKAAKSGAEHILAQRWQQLSGVGAWHFQRPAALAGTTNAWSGGLVGGAAAVRPNAAGHLHGRAPMAACRTPCSCLLRSHSAGRVWPDRELKGVCVDCFDNPGRPFRPHSSSRR